MDTVLRATAEHGRHNLTAERRRHANESYAGNGRWRRRRRRYARNARSCTARYARYGPDDADDVSGYGPKQDGHESVHGHDGRPWRTRTTAWWTWIWRTRWLRRPIASPARTVPASLRTWRQSRFWAEHGGYEPAADCHHAAGAKHGRPRWRRRQRRPRRKERAWRVLLICAGPKSASKAFAAFSDTTELPPEIGRGLVPGMILTTCDH